MFKDGMRRIDFILAWSTEPCDEAQEHAEARAIFEKNLQQEGLHLEYDMEVSWDVVVVIFGLKVGQIDLVNLKVR